MSLNALPVVETVNQHCYYNAPLLVLFETVIRYCHKMFFAFTSGDNHQALSLNVRHVVLLERQSGTVAHQKAPI